MRKKIHNLVKTILKLNEETQGFWRHGGHEWEVPHPQTAFERLSPEKQADIMKMIGNNTIHPIHGHPHGWMPGTGPLFGRDFHGKNNEDYRRLHRTVKQNLIQNLGRSHEEAHQNATDYVTNLRNMANEAGIEAHKAAMVGVRATERENRRQEAEKQKANQNTSGMNAHLAYHHNSHALYNAAMQGASDSADYFRSGGEKEREDEARKGFANIDVRHPQLSPEAKKSINALTDHSRRAIHGLVWNGLQTAGKDFVQDAKNHWRSQFVGMSPSQAHIDSAHDVLPSLLKPEQLERMLDHYQNKPKTSDMARSRAQFIEPNYGLPYEHRDLRPHLPYPDGASDSRQLRTHVGHEFHPSVKHLRLYMGTSHDEIGLHTMISTAGMHYDRAQGRPSRGSPFSDPNNYWDKAQDVRRGEESHRVAFRKAVGEGLKHIWSIPNISDHDRVLLHRHYESQLRHHYLAAVANPKMFNEYHQGKVQQEQESARRQREEQRRQSGGSSGGGGGRRRREEWPHPEQPHEILGVGQNAGPDEIRRAHRTLSKSMHPDTVIAELTSKGVDLPTTGWPNYEHLHPEVVKANLAYQKLQMAKEHMMKKHGLNEWVIFAAEWIAKRYRK